MSRESRTELLRRLEEVRGRRVLAFVLGDRQNLNTRVAIDQLSITSTLLEEIQRVPDLDVFIYSTGGITMAAFALVNLIREYATRYSAVVPYKALSAATLICLGADEILMTPLASLSPVDPSVNGPYNPLVPNQPPGTFPPQTVEVSVEDVAQYIALARKEAKLSRDEDMREVFLQLTRDVRPMALGSVHRARTQIRMLSHKLLDMHRPSNEGAVSRFLRRRRNQKIVNTMTEKLLSHDYTISRGEARGIGLNIADPNPEAGEAVMRLYRQYENDLHLLEPYNPDVELGAAANKTVTLERAYIETTASCYSFVSQHELSRMAVQGPMGVQATVAARAVAEGWRRL